MNITITAADDLTFIMTCEPLALEFQVVLLLKTYLV
jgi:hypothetical protein